MDQGVLEASEETETAGTSIGPQAEEEFDPYWDEDSVDPAIFEDEEEDKLESLTAAGWGVEAGGRGSVDKSVDDISLLDGGWGVGEQAAATGSSGAGSWVLSHTSSNHMAYALDKTDNTVLPKFSTCLIFLLALIQCKR